MRTMTHKPKIGISLRVVQAPNYDEKRDALSQDWSSLLEELGFIPVFIPNTLGSLENFLEEISLDGLVLSGGDNIGENQGRDETENKLLMYAIEKKIPVIGICRGFQYLNILSGGKINKITGHVAVKHKILIEKGVTFKGLKELIDQNVNSYHVFGIKYEYLSKKFKPLAKIKNYVEAAINIEDSQLGIMWHPEREKKFTKKSILLFKKFFSA